MDLTLPIPTRHGWGLLVPVLVLCTIGVLSIQATGGPEAGHKLTSAAANQLFYIGMGLVAAAVVVSLGYLRLGRWSYVLFALCLVALLWLILDRWVNLPMVVAQRNTRRWIRLAGIQVQPSEFAKFVYVLALAWYLRYRRNYRTFFGLFAPFALTLVPMAMILLQPDLGTVLLFLPVLFAMLYVAGAKGKHLLIIVVLAALAAPVFWFQIKSYQQLRVTSVFLQSPAVRNWLVQHPQLWDHFRGKVKKDSDDAAEAVKWRRELTDWENYNGFQLVRSKMAVGSGGVGGQGWGRGIFLEYDFLPERHNDFIFAIVAHQWGLLGCLIVLACYAAIVILGFDVATLTNDPFGRLVAVGATTLLAFQALTNICMTIGIGPVTGVTLPFVSAGGSSLISSLLCIGLLISVAQRRPMLIANPPFVFDEEAERYAPPGR